MFDNMDLLDNIDSNLPEKDDLSEEFTLKELEEIKQAFPGVKVSEEQIE
jgi:hypothetical protein